MNRKSVTGIGLTVVLTGLASAACSSGDTAWGGESLESSKHEIRNGIVIEAESLGVVTVTTLLDNVHASGAFLSPEWILTAGHVVDTITPRLPSQVMVSLGNVLVPGTPQRRATAIYIHPSHVFDRGSDPTAPTEIDVALIRLDKPFDEQASLWALSPLSKTALVGKTVECQGFGQFTDGVTPDGQLRFASGLPVASVSTNSVRVNAHTDPVSGSQIFLRGDSGGPCNDPLTQEIVGVISTGDPAVPARFGDIVPVDSFRTWVQGIMNACNAAAGSSAFCSSACPCEYGNGDCDSASQCAAGLSCAVDIGPGYKMSPTTDVCVATACNGRSLGSSSYASSACPGGHGSGDCDSNSECINDLICTTDVGPMFKMTPSTDVCLPPACSLRVPGSATYCSAACPCGHGGGGCRTDADCMPGLVCAPNIGAAFGMPGTNDVCVPPGCGSGPFSTTFCSPTCPCGHGGGDCDVDADCMPGLICGTDNGPTFGQPANWDLCVRP